MNAHELLQTALDQRHQKYVAERKRCKLEFSNEAVHDLRIASRRLLALIELFRAVIPHLRLQKLRGTFKDQLDSLDDLRDTQVMLAEFIDNIETLPELIPLQKFLRKREGRLLKAAERDIRNFKTGPIARQLENLRTKLAESDSDEQLADRLLSAVDEAHLAVSQRREHVDPSQPFTIHRVRIAFKKLRYMLEIINPILPGFPEEQFNAMHEYQASMGEIQDMEVILKTLADYAAKHPDYDPEPVRQFYTQRHRVSINAYIDDMHRADTFWRETPAKAFPWEAVEKESS